jgi:hypothetical protein
MTNEGVGSRLDTYIDIPLEIGLPHFISEDSGSDQGFEPNFTNFRMSLQSVICHRGKSLGAGHYISLVRSQRPADTTRRGRSADTSWLRFDDLAKERITSVNIHKALKDECPYLLFYQIQPIDDDDEDYDPEDRGNPPTYDEATVNGSTTDTTLSPTETITTDTTSATTLSSIPSDLTRPPPKSMLDIGLDTIQGNKANNPVTTGTLKSADPVRPPLNPSPSSKSLPSMLDVGLAAKAEQRANSTDTTDTLKYTDSIPTLLTQSPTSPSLPKEASVALEQPRPNSITLAGLDKETARKSLDIPRGRTSFQGSERRSSVAFTDNGSSFKGGSSGPITPGDETEAKSSYLSASRRNSISKAWRRSKSQSVENRLSLGDRLKSAISKDKLLSSTALSSAADELTPPDANQNKSKSGSIRRKKSTKHGHHKKPQQDKTGAETEERQCSIM